uniref:Nucleotide modification associated domain-containing protein n=1 Tax=Candidatus Kentrum sp. DK TaxID=2126562 RepID=A0A450T052_9GAMM|nr:MAG: hypothetical protein BECKDK2373B_GA0170837_10879 [Candidatus Kentron sp. DK]
MKLFSYIVAHDYGFAPNPFFGVCTLATCKPIIRRTATIGDWIIGTGSSKNRKQGSIVYVMRITEKMTFNEYWRDERFLRKRPNLRGSKKQAFGDNIYFKDHSGHWQQLNSHHSNKDGTPYPYRYPSFPRSLYFKVQTSTSKWFNFYRFLPDSHEKQTFQTDVLCRCSKTWVTI